MGHRPACIAFLLLAGAAGCADPSRLDAVEASVARVRAEGALRDRQIEWLRWGQTVLAERKGHNPGGDGREALVKQLAALQAENAALTERLARAERRLDAVRPDADRAQPQPPPSPPRPAHTRTLDDRVPYELASRPRSADTVDKPARRTLDETVPY